MARNIVFALLTVSYPLAIWLLGDQVSPRWLALSLVMIGALRLAATKQRLWILLGLGALALAAITGALNVGWPLKWYPVFVNTAMLVLFGVTLFRPPSMVERLARMKEPNLPPHAIAYTRKVTMAWCGFFLFNGSVAALTATVGTEKQWGLWNGLISYLLMGVFGGTEFLIRRQVRKKHEAEEKVA